LGEKRQALLGFYGADAKDEISVPAMPRIKIDQA
jgi:hypothetical protein